MLSDAEWAQIALDVMHRTSLSRHGEEDDGVRWIAVRHGPDHIHIVAMLARQDRARVSTWNDRYRVRDACLAAERRYGLRSTAPADRTADRCPSRAEQEKSTRRGLGEPPRTTLRRHVATAAASASSAEEFFARLDRAGVRVRLRYGTKNPSQVTGYSVSLPGDRTKAGEQVWYGGGKLAADLSWPRLSQRCASPHRPDPHLTDPERQRLWEDATRITDDAAEQIRTWSATNPAAAGDAAYAAGDALRVTAAALGSSVLRQAADSFDRAAREQYGQIPAPTPVERPPAGRPADLRLRLHHPGPDVRAAEADYPAGRAHRGPRRTAPAARRPGRSCTARRTAAARRRPSATPRTARPHGRVPATTTR
jgi:hypothetical protein